MLADHAQVAEGKLYVNGGGWCLIGPQPMPFAVVITGGIPWHDLNREHRFSLEIVDADGHPFETEGPSGPAPVVIEGAFKATPIPDMKPGSDMSLVVPINLPPLPLTPGGQYEIRLTIDGKSEADWTVPFAVRPAPQQQQAA